MSATQKTIDNIKVIAGIDCIDPAAVMRFVNETINHRQVDPTDAIHAAVLLGGLVYGVRGGDDIGKEYRRLMKVRKARTKKFDPKTAFLGTPAFAIVYMYVRKKISHSEAVARFNDEVCPASTRQIESWIAAIKPNVQITVDRINVMKTMVEKTEKKEG